MAVIRIEYATAPTASAVQWLSAEQTADKNHPYLFTQCQAIHARSLMPCQDTPVVKAPYEVGVFCCRFLLCASFCRVGGGNAVADWNHAIERH